MKVLSLLFFLYIITSSCTNKATEQPIDAERNFGNAIIVKPEKQKYSQTPENLPELTKEEQKYVGVYDVVVDNVGGETYILNPDRTSVWRFLGSPTEKYGVWKVSNGVITITSEGNTGEIEEVYKKRNGKYYNTLFEDRILKKIK